MYIQFVKKKSCDAFRYIFIYYSMCLPINNGLNYYMQSVCLNERAVRSRTPAEETRTQKCIYICHTEFSYLGMCTFFFIIFTYLHITWGYYYMWMVVRWDWKRKWGTSHSKNAIWKKRRKNKSKQKVENRVGEIYNWRIFVLLMVGYICMCVSVVIIKVLSHISGCVVWTNVFLKNKENGGMET